MVLNSRNSLFSGIKSAFSGGVGNDEDNNENDVIKARDSLTKAGYEAGEKGLGILDRALDTATKAFQKDNGLKVDGVMKPGGETETTLQTILNRKSGKSTETKGKDNNFFSKPPKPLKLQSSIGDGYDNTADDIGALENVLTGLGHLKIGDLNKGKGSIRPSIIAATKDFQKKNGLFVDGVLKPNGETQQALNEAIKPYSNIIAERQPTEKMNGRFVLIPEAEQEEVSSQVFGSGMDKEHFERTGEIRMSLTGGKRKTIPQSEYNPYAVPEYKSQYYPEGSDSNTKSRDEWIKVIKDNPNLSERERRIYTETFTAEGGDATADGTTVGGMTNKAFEDLNKTDFYQQMKDKYGADAKPSDLSTQEKQGFYKAYFDHWFRGAANKYTKNNPDDPITGSGIFDKLDNEFVAIATGDTVFRHGSSGGVEVVQKAINKTLGIEEKADGTLGTITFGRLQDIASDNKKSRDFLDSLKDFRYEDIQKNLGDLDGDRIRADHFQFPNIEF